MNDSSEQPKEESAEPDQSSELTRRLLRRATKPAGVIDTIHTRRQYQKTYDWLSRRFSMLDRWKSRYGMADDAGGSESLVFAKWQQPRAMITESADFSFADGRRDQASESIAVLSRMARPTIAPLSSDVSVSSSAQFRVVRRRADDATSPERRSADAASNRDAEDNISRDSATPGVSENPITRSAASPDANFSDQSAKQQTADRIVLRTPEIKTVRTESSAPDSPSSPSAISIRQSAKSIESERDPSAHLTRRAAPTEATRRLMKSERDLSAVEIRSQQPSFDGLLRSVGPTAYATAPRMTERTPQRSNEQMPSFNQSAIVSNFDETAREPASFSDHAPHLGRTVSVESESRMADLPLFVPLVQRQVVAAARPDESVSSDVRRFPLQPETRAASPEEKPAMIWRQSNHGFVSDGASRMTARNDSSRSSIVSLSPQSASPQTAAFETSTVAASSPGGIDIADVAERVWRMVSRRLEIERERRGR
jgi:hypothetical protein